MIILSDLGFSVGARVLFDGVNLSLNRGSRYGIVGANGVGKSTLLRLVMREEESSFGSLHIQKEATVGWLKQDQHLYDTAPLIEVVMRGRPALWETLCQKEALLNKADWTEADGYTISALEETIAEMGGYEAEGLASGLLEGLGIPHTKHNDPLGTLSGGYKLRVLLARALFDAPDILLLDEPTNYLDIDSIQWLEKYLLTSFQGLLLFVSHDWDFLDHLSTHILDIDYGEIRPYTGSFTDFLKKKETVIEQKKREFKSLEAKAAKQRAFIEKFRASPTRSRQALAREKQLEKWEWPDIESSSRIQPHFRFANPDPSGHIVLKAHQLHKSFSGRSVVHKVDLEIARGEKVAILGPNGVGKSTLIKLLIGALPADSGTVKWGHNATFSYFGQELREQLMEKETIWTWLDKQHPSIPDEKRRGTLGSVLFSEEEVNKSLEVLSGGEMARLLLAKIMLDGRNTLIFDEPTNHLDLEAREALAAALKAYKGTVLFVSHDRHFVHKTASRTLHLTLAS